MTVSCKEAPAIALTRNDASSTFSLTEHAVNVHGKGYLACLFSTKYILASVMPTVVHWHTNLSPLEQLPEDVGYLLATSMSRIALLGMCREADRQLFVAGA